MLGLQVGLSEETLPFHHLCSIMFFLMTLSLFISYLTEELEDLQLVVNNVARALNAWGDLVVNRL